jgi:hypothetical protein
MNDETDELSPHEREAFDRLEKEKIPPPFLERRIVAALRDAQSIRANRIGWLPGRRGIGITVAASMCFFILGILVGVWSVSAQSTKPMGPATPRGPVFVLAMRNPPQALPANSKDEVLQRMEEFGAWVDELERKGLTLGHDCQLLSEINGPNSILDTSSDAPGGSLMGIVLLQVENYEQAVEAAKSCPHWKYGGIVEIKQLR